MKYFVRGSKRVAGIYLFLWVLWTLLYPVKMNVMAAQDDDQIHIRVTAGDQEFSAVLHDNKTTRAWVAQMPMTLDMSELNGNEKYYYLTEDLPTNSKRPSAIHTGDLMLYGSNCIVLFYKDFNTSYSYTSLGYIENPTGLADALGDGGVTVSFALNDEESSNIVDPPKPEKVKIRTITLSGDVAKLAKGKKVKLKAAVLPINASKKDLKWTSSNKKVATVSAQGVITGKRKGTATITAKATDGSGKKGIYKITVVTHAVKKISLKSRIRTVEAGKKAKVTAIVSTTGKTANKKLVWTTSNKKYATVNTKGVVTARKAGKGKTVLITAKATDGSGKKASIRIKIK